MLAGKLRSRLYFHSHHRMPGSQLAHVFCSKVKPSVCPNYLLSFLRIAFAQNAILGAIQYPALAGDGSGA
jgi:hypothetical protein